MQERKGIWPPLDGPVGVLGSHQPDLFPYTGFFYKLAASQVFDLAVHDQFQKQGYQRRVRMRGSWCSVPVLKPPMGAPIHTVQLAPGAKQVLADTVTGRYRDAPFWKLRGQMVLDWIASAPDTRLWTLNQHLIGCVAEFLEIDTPIHIAEPPAGRQMDGILDLCAQYAPKVYLSGAGGTAYMGEDAGDRLALQGTQLWWVRHEPWTGDSILTTLFEREHPASDVLAGSVEEETRTA